MKLQAVCQCQQLQLSMSVPKITAAFPKNMKTIEIAKLKQNNFTPSDTSIFPNNKVYLSGSSPTKQFPRDKLIEQNKKLKKQLVELSSHMDEVIAKSITRKKKYGMNLEEEIEAGTPEQNSQIKNQQSKLASLRSEIFNLKKQNQYVWCQSAVVEKQNSIKALEAQIKPLEVEIKGLQKIRREQYKALTLRKNDSQLNEKIQKTKQQLFKVKEECKILSLKTLENQKLLLKAHEKTVAKNQKIKEIEDKIKQNKEKLRKGEQNIVTMEMISQIEEEITKLEAQYQELTKNWTEKINNLDIQQNSRRIEEQKKLMILKEKEKEATLNDIRLKQFRKLVVQSRSEQKMERLQGTRQFRNKRNIKYLQKNAF